MLLRGDRVLSRRLRDYLVLWPHWVCVVSNSGTIARMCHRPIKEIKSSYHRNIYLHSIMAGSNENLNLALQVFHENYSVNTIFPLEGNVLVYAAERGQLGIWPHSPLMLKRRVLESQPCKKPPCNWGTQF